MSRRTLNIMSKERAKSEPPPIKRNSSEEENVVNGQSNDGDNQTNPDDIGNGTSRSFGLLYHNEFQDLNIFDSYLSNPPLTTEIPPERGTPQKRLHDLLFACDTIVKSNPKIFKTSKKYNNEIITRIQEFSTVSREDMLKNGRKDFIERYINLFLSDLLANKHPEDPNYRTKIIMLLWSIIIVKSISDISQCGSFVNDIPKIIKQVLNPTSQTSQSVMDSGHSNTASSSEDLCRQVNYKMKDNLNMCFVSSDGSCAAFSTNVLRLIDYPIPILHSRKTGKTTQTMILQKSKISVLSVILSLANENTYEGAIDDFIRNILNNTQHLSEGIDASIIRVFSEIYRLTREYYENLIRKYYQKERREYIDTQPSLNKLLEKEIDEMFANPDNYYIVRKNLLCKLIDEISKIETSGKILEKSLDEISTVLSFDSKDINVPRWAYHISNDVFKYLYSLPADASKQSIERLKQEISLQEILSATADAMYCHDFELECLYTLGKSFLESIGQENLYQDIKIFDDDKQKNKSYDVIEKECIAATLALNRYSTLNQHDDHFEICFNPLYNFIKRDKNEGGYRNAQVPWNIGFSPFIKTPLVAAIDFTIGESTFSSAFIGQINQINKIRNVRYLLPFASINSSEELRNNISELKKNASLYEYCGVTTLYDGAAPYGAIPLVYAEPPYETIINTTVGKYKITTQTTKSDKEIADEWVESRFTLRNLVLLENYIAKLPEDIKLRFYSLKTRNKNDPYYFFNLIWGTILNSNPKLSNTYKGVIYSEYNRIITDVLNKIEILEQNEILKQNERLKQNNSLGRPQREKASYATGSNDFDDYTQFIHLKEYLQYVKNTIRHTGDKFDKIMNIYIGEVLGINQYGWEDANTLLKILELAVFNKSNESIDADMFAGLNSNILQQYSKRDLNEVQQNLVDQLRTTIERINELNNMAIGQNKNLGEVVKTSSNQLQKYATYESQEASNDYMNDPDHEVYSSAPAVLERKKKTQDQQRLSPPHNPITLEDFNSSPSSTISTRSSSPDPSSPDTKVAKKPFNMPEESSLQTTQPLLKRISSDPTSDRKRRLDPQDKSKGSKGGSRKHHIQTHKTVTRRKNKKSPKRKTIKKRKMQKRNNKTRRNK